MISTKDQIRAFNPDPGDVRPTKMALASLSESERARAVLAGGHPKSRPVKLHKGTREGPRTGLPHLTPHSTRYVQAHAARGTRVEKAGDGP